MNYFHRFTPNSQRLRDFRRSRYVVIRAGEKGQALVEYMLMLVVAVILIVGLTITFFVPLRNFVADLNNTYIRCLLETGELPRVGTDSSASCDAEVPKFQLGSASGGGAPGSKGGGNKQNTENQKGESSSSDGSSGTEAGKSADNNGGASGGLSNRRSSMIRNGMRTRGNARGESGGDKTTNIPIDDFNAGEGFVSTNAAGRLSKAKQKTKQIDLSGLTEYDRKKIERAVEKNRSIAVDSEEFTQKRNRKLLVKPPPEKKLEQDLNVQTDFGGYFKIFFFIVIILFIIILMGSQAMQMTNSSDD